MAVAAGLCMRMRFWTVAPILCQLRSELSSDFNSMPHKELQSFVLPAVARLNRQMLCNTQNVIAPFF